MEKETTVRDAAETAKADPRRQEPPPMWQDRPFALNFRLNGKIFTLWGC